MLVELFIVIIGFSIMFSLLMTVGWIRIPDYSPNSNNSWTDLVTVIVPVRNEGDGILQLVNDLSNQSFPKTQLQIVVVDDHSTDNTVGLVKNYKFKKGLDLELIQNVGKGKKSAIETGINNAKGEIIMTTDGDCRVGPDWVGNALSFYKKKSLMMVTGPVKYNRNNSIWEQALMMEFAALQGIGAVTLSANKPTMCNGANFIYSKRGFEDIMGFTGNTHIPSGDDEFLMHKFSGAFQDAIKFIKCRGSIVETRPVDVFRDFVNQRLRWASKWSAYQTWPPKLVSLLVLLFNINMLFGAYLFVFESLDLRLFAGAVITKILFDYLFVLTVNKFFRCKSNILIFFFLEIIYPLYVICFGLLGFTGNYTWKGRHSKSDAHDRK